MRTPSPEGLDNIPATILHILCCFLFVFLVTLWIACHPTDMIHIDLREIPIFVLNMEEDPESRASMTAQLDTLGLRHQFVSAIKCDPAAVGVSISHLKTLRQKGLTPPFLVLEDDCKFLPDRFSYCYDLPPETDALYLGHSLFGLSDKKDDAGVRWGLHNHAQYAFYDDRYIRILNMLSRHAIVYISDRYMANAIEANLSALLDNPYNIPGDIMYAEMQPKHLVLSPRETTCYQTGKFEIATRPSLPSCLQPSMAPGAEETV